MPVKVAALAEDGGGMGEFGPCGLQTDTTEYKRGCPNGGSALRAELELDADNRGHQ